MAMVNSKLLVCQRVYPRSMDIQINGISMNIPYYRWNCMGYIHAYKLPGQKTTSVLVGMHIQSCRLTMIHGIVW